MSAKAVGRRYAGALFDVVKKNNTIGDAQTGLAAFAALVKESAELAKVFASPAVPAQKKAAVAETLVQHLQAPVEVQRLVAALGERDRLMFVGDVAAAFDERVNKERQILQADVTTAVPLAPAAADALAAALGQAAGGTVKIAAHVDPSIIGGVVARVGSVVFDGSVARQLERMKSQLANSQQ